MPLSYLVINCNLLNLLLYLVRVIRIHLDVLSIILLIVNVLILDYFVLLFLFKKYVLFCFCFFKLNVLMLQMRYKSKFQKKLSNNIIMTKSILVFCIESSSYYRHMAWSTGFANKFTINNRYYNKINHDCFSGKTACKHSYFIILSFSSYICNFFLFELQSKSTLSCSCQILTLTILI